MKFTLSVCCVLLSLLCAAQDDQLVPAGSKTSDGKTVKQPDVLPKATIDMYRIVSVEKDTVFVDTSLTIHDQYKFNYLRKDTFGLLPFANEGQPYQILDHGLRRTDAFPDFGHLAKQTAYIGPGEIRYYSVATPFTDLYYKSVMEQGQSVDAFVTANISPQLNFSIAYKGLRSLGKYINQLTSAGNFRLTTSYHTKSNRYQANFHFVSHDVLNQENGGITNVADFESDDERYQNRERLNVYFRDAQSFLRSKRLFLDHSFRVNGNDVQNNLYLTHRFNYETKFFEFNQPTLETELDDGTEVTRFGTSYRLAGVNDQTHYNRMYNKVGAAYENKTIGRFQFFLEDFRYNYYYDRVLILDNQLNTGLLSDEIQTAGGQYEYRKNNWQAQLMVSNSITDQSLSIIDGRLGYRFNDKNKVSFRYQTMNKLPDHLYNLNQSSHVAYNWANDFNNEKINNIFISAETQWLNASAQISSFRDMLYFSDDDPDTHIQLVSPKQYEDDIKYLSVKVSREIKWWKLALDNTILYQQADEDQNVLNVPKIVTRNTLYFTDYFFKKALYLQTGVTLNYFTKYYANDYSPVLGEFFTQDQKKIGEFPMLDFFLSAKIRTARIFFICAHFNSAWTGNNFLTAPNYPYRDFTLRFGMEWNFFK